MKPHPIDDKMVDIVYLLNNFNTTIWCYLFTGLIISSIVFIFISYSFRSMSPNDMADQFFTSFWHYFTLSVDAAPSTISSYKSAIILWTSIVLSVFYAIHLILMGTLSPDLTCPVMTRMIDTLDDLLYDTELNSTVPIIFRQFNMFSVLKNSRNGTGERELYNKIMANTSTSVIELDLDNSEETGSIVLDLLKNVGNQQIAIIENSEVVTTQVAYAGCYVEPKIMREMKPSREIIAQSILSGLMSKSTPLEVQKFLQYRLLTFDEFGILRAIYQTTPVIVKAVVGIDITTEGIICSEQVSGIYTEHLELLWKQLGIDPFERLIKICLGVVFIAGVALSLENDWYRRRLVLIIEAIYKRFSHRRRKIKTIVVEIKERRQPLSADAKKSKWTALGRRKSAH